jgi:hypothetical protein
LAGPDSDPKLRGIEPETADLCRDVDRLMPVKGKNPDAELELRRGNGEMGERVQAWRAWLVV